jgi:hypothetical protein
MEVSDESMKVRPVTVNQRLNPPTWNSLHGRSGESWGTLHPVGNRGRPGK